MISKPPLRSPRGVTPRRLVPSTPSAPGTESRRASSPPPSRGGIRPRRGRPRHRSRSRNRTRTRTRTLHRSPSRPRSHPMRSVFETSWDRTAPCIFFPEDDGPTRDRFPSSTHNGAPHLRPSLLRPSLLRPHFCASLLRHSLQHPSCGTRRRFSAARRGFLRRPSSRRDVRARAYLGSRRRLLDGAKPFGQSTNLHLHALARFANGGEDHLRVALSIGAIHLERSKRAKNHVLRFLLARRGSHRRAVYAAENLADAGLTLKSHADAGESAVDGIVDAGADVSRADVSRAVDAGADVSRARRAASGLRSGEGVAPPRASRSPPSYEQVFLLERVNVLERFGRFGDGRRSARKHLGGVGRRVRDRRHERLPPPPRSRADIRLSSTTPARSLSLSSTTNCDTSRRTNCSFSSRSASRPGGRSRAGMRGTTRRGGRHRRRTSLGCSFRRGGRCAGGLRRARQSLEGVVVILRAGNGADANGTRDGTRDGIQDDIPLVGSDRRGGGHPRRPRDPNARRRRRRGSFSARVWVRAGVGRGRVRKEVEVHVLEETVAFQSRDVEGFRNPASSSCANVAAHPCSCVSYSPRSGSRNTQYLPLCSPRASAVTRDTVDPAGRGGVVATGFARGVDAEAEETTEAEVFVRIVRLALLGRWRRGGFASRTPAGPLLANDTRGLEVGFVALGRYRRAFVRPHGERVVRRARWRRACARAMVSHSVGGGASGGDARSRRALLFGVSEKRKWRPRDSPSGRELHPTPREGASVGIAEPSKSGSASERDPVSVSLSRVEDMSRASKVCGDGREQRRDGSGDSEGANRSADPTFSSGESSP